MQLRGAARLDAGSLGQGTGSLQVFGIQHIAWYSGVARRCRAFGNLLRQCERRAKAVNIGPCSVSTDVGWLCGIELASSKRCSAILGGLGQIWPDLGSTRFGMDLGMFWEAQGKW